MYVYVYMCRYVFIMYICTVDMFYIWFACESNDVHETHICIPSGSAMGADNVYEPSVYRVTHMGVSINGGTPKFLVYNGKSYLKWMIWGYPHILGNLHMSMDLPEVKSSRSNSICTFLVCLTGHGSTAATCFLFCECDPFRILALLIFSGGQFWWCLRVHINTYTHILVIYTWYTKNRCNSMYIIPIITTEASQFCCIRPNALEWIHQGQKWYDEALLQRQQKNNCNQLKAW